MNDLPSSQVLAIPEILCMVIDFLDAPTLKTASLVCKTWHHHTRLILWRQLVIPKDWYDHDLSPLWPILDRQGNAVRVMSLELSTAARMKQDVDMDNIKSQLAGLLSRTPNLDSLSVQLSRDTTSSIVTAIAENATQIEQLNTDLQNWEPDDMAGLLAACPRLRKISGYNFSGDVLKAIARTQPTLNRLDCTHPRFDDEELIAFAKQFPDMLQLSILLHQFLTSKALVGIAQHCHSIEHLGFHFCLGLQSMGFQAIFNVSTNLRFLDLGPSEVNDADISLVAAQCPRLESLKLPFCANITHIGISAIVHSCRHLRHLDLSWCDRVLLSIFNTETPWVCKGLRYLDISGIHAAYFVEASMASALLPSMYHQLSLLTELQQLKLSGHGFSLRLLDLGEAYLAKLKRLEMLDIIKLKNPIPWKDMIEIGNLFPRLTDFQFRSSDVIPPLSAAERVAIKKVTEEHKKRGPFTSAQPVPGEVLGGNARSTTSTAIAPSSLPLSSATDLLSDAIAKPSSPKRRRSRSPSPPITPVDVSSSSTSPVLVLTEGVDVSSVVAQETNENDEDEGEDELVDGVMKATLRSGLEISFQLSGEDEEEGPDISDAAWGFPTGQPF
ncbi:hypothetical protein EDD21DRAFT_374150 [Dissophora ornata]|nr:hypothetical protein EDD21DRAFT_374150 [Dissophora ornata]